MEKFYAMCDLIGKTLPDLVSLILCPALLVLAGLLLAVFHKRKAYPPVAVFLGGAAAFLVSCETAGAELLLLFAYLGLFAALAAAVELFFLIPFPVRGNGRQEELFRKFYEPLSEAPASPEEEERYGAEECGLRLDHAVSLLEQLLQCPLTPGDRLEADSLSRKIDGFRGRALTEEETRTLNDCLATVLKLTAKYKL